MHFFSNRSQHTAPSDFGKQVAPEAYWSLPAERLMAQLDSAARGLTKREATRRLRQYGPNALKAMKRATALGLFANQFKSPLVLILIVASIISLVAAEWIDAGMVLVIVVGSTLLGFAQEYIAGNAIEQAALEGHHPLGRPA